MSERARYVIELVVSDRQRFDEWRMCVSSDDFPVFSERFVDDIRDPGPVPIYSSFDDVVRTFKKREFRRELLLQAAKKLAARLSDYIEDKEGWHGEGRRERIKRGDPSP